MSEIRKLVRDLIIECNNISMEQIFVSCNADTLKRDSIAKQIVELVEKK